MFEKNIITNRIENKKKESAPIWIIDTTLRDGEQAPGVVFSAAEKVHIASMLVEAGVDEIETGIPVMGEDERDIIRLLRREVPGVRLTNWCRGLKADIEMAAACNTGSIHISFPASSILLNAFDKNESWICSQMASLIPEARKYFDHISIGAQDATRSDVTFLKKMIAMAGEFGADRFCIADTVGIATPLMIQTICLQLIDHNPKIVLGFHGHNDLGMATANTIAAVSAGAKAMNVTVNGLGERAGNACFEEVAAALTKAMGLPTNIDFQHVQKLCRMVADITSRPIPPDKPITGRDVFTHESGIHCRALIKDQNTYQSLLPAAFGRNTAHFRIGKSSGTAVIRHLLHENGMDIDLDTIKKAMPHIRETALRQKRCLSIYELELIISGINENTNKQRK